MRRSVRKAGLYTGMAMLKIKSILFAVSLLAMSAGLVVTAVGAFLLRRLDDHMFEHSINFHDLAGHYGSITSAGAPVCLAGCIGLALAMDRRQAFHAGVVSAIIGLATSVFGLFVFNLHSASGAVYFTLIGVMFGASVIFFVVASARYVWYRTDWFHQRH